MKCPIDGENLVMAERQGIEIDYCPKCRGVWLDRGELDKIIERAVPTASAIAPEPATMAPPPAGGLFSAPPPREDRRHDGRYDDDRRHEGGRYRPRDDDDDHRRYPSHDPRAQKRKRGGFLGELFDFD